MARWRCAILIGLSALAFLSGAATTQADVVRLRTGNGKFGQGWMFLDTDGTCKVVTAAHVIRAPDGAIQSPFAIDITGHEWQTGPALVVSTDPDIAVLPVPSANTPSACGTGRLSAIGAERRLADMNQAVIETTGQSEIIQVPVARHASVMDRAKGDLFSVRPVLPSDRIMKGWSGSVVLDRDGPLGIIFDVDPDHNEASAVRVDAIRRLMATAPARAAGPAASDTKAAIGVLAGVTDDPRAGPDRVLGSGWHVTPVRRTVVFVVAFPQPRALREISLLSDKQAGNTISGLGVAVEAEGSDDWLDLAFCRAANGSDAVACPMLQHTVERIRVLVKAANDSPLVLKGLRFQ